MWNSSIICTEIGSRCCFNILFTINFCQFFNNWKIILNFPKFFKIRINSTFVMKTFQMKVYHFENIRNSFSERFSAVLL